MFAEDHSDYGTESEAVMAKFTENTPKLARKSVIYNRRYMALSEALITFELNHKMYQAGQAAWAVYTSVLKRLRPPCSFFFSFFSFFLGGRGVIL